MDFMEAVTLGVCLIVVVGLILADGRDARQYFIEQGVRGVLDSVLFKERAFGNPLAFARKVVSSRGRKAVRP
jgi:hypothetical protein